MRRWIKAKAAVLCLAWLVLFLHDAIPHNHSDHPGAGCHTLVHATESDDTDRGIISHLFNSHQHDSSRVCHFSANLFTKHSLENFAAVVPTTIMAVTCSKQIDFRVTRVVAYSSASPLSGASLRAPPSFS